MENNSTDDLSVIAEARAAMADRLITPWWYHPILGALVVVYVLALGLGSTPVMIAGVAVVLAGGAALVAAYRRVTGVWISGTNAGAASKWAYALGGLVGGSAATAVAIGRSTDLHWPVYVLAAVCFVATIVLGHRFDVALRAQLRAGA